MIQCVEEMSKTKRFYVQIRAVLKAQTLALSGSVQQ